jgi:protein-S-isoprenylcysteine O-methyltransferase Ste14
MALVHLWDSAISGLAAVAALAICGVPSWFTFRAIQGGLAPTWAYLFVALLAGVGIILAVAFGRKAIEGVGPGRDRRR